MTPTPLLDTYWRFAAERQVMFFNRLADPAGLWTDDPILSVYRFTNAYRASDRVSQYLIREVQYRNDRPQIPRELFFRTLLFKFFNRVETWEAIENKLGPLVWESVDLSAIERILDDLLAHGRRIYSAAYIMPAPRLGRVRKHANHLALLRTMMEERLPERVRQAPSLRRVYELLATYPGLGPFLACQYAIDLNYSELLDFEEAEFVVAGPGALDGLTKCFEDFGGKSAEAVIHAVTEDQDRAFAALGLKFKTLYGRRLQPIDCQNLLCEISKYARVSHPEIRGLYGRSRIKQGYRRSDRPLPAPFYPPRWRLQLGSEKSTATETVKTAELLI